MYSRRSNRAVSVLTDRLRRARSDFGKTSSCRAGTPEKSNLFNLQAGQEAAPRLTESFDSDKMSGHPSPVRPSGCPDVNPLTEMRGSELKPNGGTDPTHTESASGPPPASGEPTMLDEWEPLITEAVRQRFSGEAYVGMVLSHIRGLFGFMSIRGVRYLHDATTALVVEWIWAPGKTHSGEHYRPAVSTARSRRRSAVVAFEEARARGAQIDPTELVGERIVLPSDVVRFRPLTDEEIEQGRAFSDPGPITDGGSLMFALVEVGRPSEVTRVRTRDIDLDAGTVAFSGPAARVCPFSEWGLRIVRLFFANAHPLAPDDLVCFAPLGARVSAGRAVEARVRHILVSAGLAEKPGVSVGSIRLYSARKVFEAHGIEAAARFLGTASLDAAARAVGHNWRQGDGCR